jgi:hypothetical protein
MIDSPERKARLLAEAAERRKKYNDQWNKYSKRFEELKRLKREEALRTSVKDCDTFPFAR